MSGPLSSATLKEGWQDDQTRRVWMLRHALMHDSLAQAASGFDAPTYYSAATVTTISGTYVSGNAASIATPYDGNYYVVDETATTPGFEIDFSWSGIGRPPTEIILRASYYENNAVNHDVELQMFNYNTSGWDSLVRLPDTQITGAFAVYTLPFPSFTNYVSGVASRARLYHVTSGSASHIISVDYIALRASI